MSTTRTRRSPRGPRGPRIPAASPRAGARAAAHRQATPIELPPTAVAAAIAQAESEARMQAHPAPAVPPMDVPPSALGISPEVAGQMAALKPSREDSSGAPLPASYPYRARLRRGEYEAEKKRLQVELLKVQSWVKATGQRVVMLFEGRDAAGKGGTIKRFTEHLNPRGARVVALEKPSDRERGQWYFQRYIEHLPSHGEMVFFDRSWYNRAGVEQVMGFATVGQVKAFLAQAPVFEKLLVDDGLLLFKYWLTCDQAEQEARFAERHADALKRWKLSPVDVAARSRYGDYTRAREAMLKATHTRHAPWTLVDFNDQRRGRLTLIRHLLDRLPDTRVPDTALVLQALSGKLQRERFGTLKPLPVWREG